jgi:hypothetical protein
MKHLRKIEIYVALLVLILANIAIIPEAFAGGMTNASVLETGAASNVNPMIASDAQEVAFEFDPATTVSSGYTVTLTFGYGGTLWTQTTTPTASSGVVAVTGSQTVAAGSCATLFPGTPTFLPGTLAIASSQAAGTVTITSSGASDTITSGTTYCATLTSNTAVTNPTGAGTYNVQIATPSDTETVSIDVLSAAANVYSVTATVAPTFTMTLTGSLDAMGTLGSGGVKVSAGIPVAIATNAADGWFVWAEDSNNPSGLHSPSAATTIPTVPTGANQTMSSGTYGPTHAYYGLAVSANNTTNYAYNGGTTGGGLAYNAFNEIATSGSAGSASFTAYELANIAAATPAATDYTDTITLIGAGSF